MSKKNKSCRCSHCVKQEEPYSSWKNPHRVFTDKEPSYPTDRISTGSKVKLASGETGKIVGKSWSLYEVAIDQLDGEVRSFEDKWIELCKS